MNLMELAERCEKAEGPDRELDLDIWRLTEPSAASVEAEGKVPLPWLFNVTASLDAAMQLIPDEWTAWELRSTAKKTQFSADLSRLTECDAGEDWAHGRGKTPALAMAAASLRARASIANSLIGGDKS